MRDVLDPGHELFGYRIEKTIGKGGMGTVYLATQLSLNRPVALKVLHPSRVKNTADAEAFFQEAAAAARLSHPNLVAVHDLQHDPSLHLYCYSMECVEGRTLSQLVAEQGPLKRNVALHYIYQAAGALAHAHKHDFVHRDVKPDNLLVTSKQVVKLLDLGLAYNRIGGLHSGGGGGSRRLVLIGTPDYAAPEQCRNPDVSDPASDVWSLGATFHFLLTGRPPFAGCTVIDLIVRASQDPLVVPEGITPDCAALLELMLHKDPERRLGDGQEVLDALKEIAQGRMPQAPVRGNSSETQEVVPLVDSPVPGVRPRKRLVVRRRTR
jgi:serine/threonine protein kinase